MAARAIAKPALKSAQRAVNPSKFSKNAQPTSTNWQEKVLAPVACHCSLLLYRLVLRNQTHGAQRRYRVMGECIDFSECGAQIF